MNIDNLAETANILVGQGKGILAADESTATIGKRLDSVGVENTVSNRRSWRQLLFTAPGEWERHISGVILYDETLHQSTDNNISFVDVLKRRGVIPGIKVDMSTHRLQGAPGEVFTEGLDGLRERLNQYREAGAFFAKWRAVIAIGDDIPSNYCIEVNSHSLARFAAFAQEAGLVPIVEPEILMDGDHDINRCFEVTEATLKRVYEDLYKQRVALEGTLLKPNMVISGSGDRKRAGPEEVAEKTIRCLKRAVPSAVPGVVFLSGGQSDDEATLNLNALNCRNSDIYV